MVSIKHLQAIQINITCDRIKNKIVNGKGTIKGCSLDEAVDIVQTYMNKLKLELEIQRGKLVEIPQSNEDCGMTKIGELFMQISTGKSEPK